METWDQDKFWLNFDSARRAKGKTKRWVGKLCKISAAAVGAWKGANRPQIEHVFLVARALGVSPSWMVFDEGERHLTPEGIADLDLLAGLSVEERAGVMEIVRLLLRAHRPPIRAMPPVDASRESDDTGPDSDACDRSESEGIA